MPEPHPLIEAVAPLVDRLGASLVNPAEAAEGDVPLSWEGAVVAAVRLPPGVGAAAPVEATAPAEAAVGDLSLILEEVARTMGGDLGELPRAEKQRAVRILEERGAFTYRKSAETIAEALGVTRFTVYNYLNRQR